jgi:CRISPR-associated protein Csb2
MEIEYLTGRAVACMPGDRDAAEWPPHPGRLFMALVAAHLERSPDDMAERAALLWLEQLKPPEISASAATARDVREVFVPVNDNFGPSNVPRGGFSPSIVADKIRVLPERRSKQARTFPSVTPDAPFVFFVWPEIQPDQLAEYRPAVERLTANVTCLGHSSSLVRVAVRDDAPPATYVPSDDGTRVLRVPTPGRFNDLIAYHQAGRRPSAGFFCSYAEVALRQEQNESVFGSLVTFRISGPPLSLTATARLTSAVRDAVMKCAQLQPAPEILSGHSPDNAPSQRNHIAYMPLAFVGHPHADGMIRGFAAVIPKSAVGDERRLALRALGRLARIWLGPSAEWKVDRVNEDTALKPLKSLMPFAYTRPSRRWATITPMVFDQFPKERPGRNAAAIVARACRRIGLPEPIEVDVCHVSRCLGVPISPEFKIVPKPGVPTRPYAHVSLRFDRSVSGPVLLGAGRYQGLGVFRAVDP